MSLFNYKSITDPLYGYVGLSEVEAAIVSSSSFQRLHNVRQLGLVHLVFPSASYSRFSHSIGACHNAGRIIDAIKLNAPSVAINDSRKQIYRLAALLHDIGHYPFSHATEHAIQSFYVGENVLNFDGDDSGNASNGTGLHHEDVGRVIIENDPELDKIFKKHGINRAELLNVFSKSDPDALFGLISSDLDCDRLDYLPRSAHASGVPYGIVDVDFIIGKATVDKDGILCFQSKAATAIDHFLVSRFYDYMQVVYHKTVMGLEWSLDFAVVELLKRSLLKISSTDVMSLVNKSEWADFDDSHLFSQFKTLKNSLGQSAGTQLICDHLRSILHRQPPKLVYKWESISQKDDKTGKLTGALVKAKVKEISQELGIDERRFLVNQRKPFPFSSDLSGLGNNLSHSEQARSVSILEKGKKKSTLLTKRPDCLISTMSEMRNFAINVLYLPSETEPKSVREKIRKQLSDID